MPVDKLRGVVADLTETFRRIFLDPPVKTFSTDLPPLGVNAVPPLEVAAKEPGWRMDAHTSVFDTHVPCSVCSGDVAWTSAVHREDAWSRWSTGTVVHEMPVFPMGGHKRVEVPPLPRAARPKQLDLGGFRVRAAQIRDPLRALPPRQIAPQLPPPIAHQSLALAFSAPIPIDGENLEALSKALWMRYSLRLVKVTGQNIRNLDVLGIYNIPEKGVQELRHDARTGRLWITLGPEAARSKRSPFMLARRRDDRSLVSCFLGED